MPSDTSKSTNSKGKDPWVLQTELLTDVPDWYYDVLKDKLDNDPNYAAKRDRFILDDSQKTIVHILCKVRQSEIEGLTDEQQMYYPICSREEIERIFNPQDAEDFLLKIRADEVNDHPRIARVFFSLREHYGKDWSFEEYFSSHLFGQYTILLSPELEAHCDNLIAGFVNYPAVNGFCAKTQHGDVILISHVLKHYLYYINMWTIGDHLGLSEQDMGEALIIAVRTMLGFESLDFEIDSRANLPESMHQELEALTNYQLKFIIGHEFAHQYLGHLQGAEVTDLSKVSMIEDRIGDLKIYSYSQQHELDADYHSIASLETGEVREVFLNAAFTFFIGLDIFQCFKDYILPGVGNFKSHPTAIERILELRKKFPEDISYSSTNLDTLIDRNSNFKEYLVNNFIGFHVDDIEMYGTNYIKSFKAKRPLDRLDF